ncbi:hypothetical protein DY000_02055961 [Brassica cretica]|uniref:protein-serine/threonine phosphatase n=1 Tax=Brassica cretica TaxID=69181 RepID=A0ABQ7A9C0_BRACR|nr:hypothetical protein DY000_02055961 [Brassica cretica]
MLATLMKLLSACLWPSSGRSVDSSGKQDGLLWYKDSGQHLLGDFSMAVVQANNLLEDQSQVESGPLSTLDSGPYGTFIGIYDGHGGPETSRFVNDHLFQHLKRFAAEQGSMSMDVIRKAYEATEEGFLGVVTKQWPVKPLIAAVGSCCLVGVICGGMLYIANISRSIGDMYLKKAEFNREPLYTKYRLREPIKRPILSGEPSITEHELQPQDQFLIFASDGLWEQLSNQEAVDIVQNHPRNGIARRLVKTAMQAAAKKREMRYSDLMKIERGVRRHFHDDITVVVIYLDTNVVSSAKGPSLSIRGRGMTFPKKL